MHACTYMHTQCCNHYVCMYIVHGGWSSWACKSCSRSSCGIGKQKCIRRCDSPSPACNGNGCPGSGIKEQICKTCCPGKVLKYDLCLHTHGYSCLPLFQYDCNV